MFLRGAFFRDPSLPVALAAGLLLPLAAAAQPAAAPRSFKTVSASFYVSLTVRPDFRVLDVVPLPGGQQYRIWTNMKSTYLNGRQYHFQRPGEHVIFVPSLAAAPGPQPLLFGLARVRPETGRETVTVQVDF